MTHLIKSNQKYTPNGECYINDFCVEKNIKIERTDKNYQYKFPGSAAKPEASQNIITKKNKYKLK